MVLVVDNDVVVLTLTWVWLMISTGKTFSILTVQFNLCVQKVNPQLKCVPCILNRSHIRILVYTTNTKGILEQKSFLGLMPIMAKL